MHQRMMDDAAFAVADCDLDYLYRTARPDCLCVDDERAGVELVRFQRWRVRLSGVVEHGLGTQILPRHLKLARPPGLRPNSVSVRLSSWRRVARGVFHAA